MRKIIDIVSDAREGKIPSHEECFYAMLALHSKMHFYHRDLMAISESHQKGKVKGIAVALRANNPEKVMEDRMIFSKKDPLEWLGKSGNPFTEESKQWRDMAKKILEKALKK